MMYYINDFYLEDDDPLMEFQKSGFITVVNRMLENGYGAEKEIIIIPWNFQLWDGITDIKPPEGYKPPKGVYHGKDKKVLIEKDWSSL